MRGRITGQFNGRNLFWSIMLLDMTFQVFHFGGMTFLDQLFHAGCLFVASLILIFRKRVRKVSPVFYVPALVLLGTALLQILPLPTGIQRLFCSEKLDLLASVEDLFSLGIESNSITLLPSYHRVRLSSWFLDSLFFMLVLLGPYFSKKKLYLWIGALSFGLGSLSLMVANGKLPEQVQEWVGGPGNANQFAGFLVFLTAIGTGVVIGEVSRWRSSTRRSPYKRFPVLASAFVGIVLNILALFPLGSRAGFLLLVTLILSLPLWWFVNSEKRKWVFGGTALVAVIGLVVMINLPAEKLTMKVDSQGFSDAARLELIHIGRDELKKVTILGQGLGASAGLLGHRFPSGPNSNIEMTEFHNDWIQILVEMGLPGLIVLGFLFYWAFLLLREADSSQSVGEQFFLFSVVMVLLLVGLQSMVSFPLRIIGIRMFVLFVLGMGLRATSSKKARTKKPLLVFILMVIGIGGFLINSLPRLPYLDDENPKIHRAALYGTVHHVPLFKANEAVRQLLKPMPFSQDGSVLWKDAYKWSGEALKAKPTSIRAMNLLFQLDLIREASVFNRTNFETFKTKALAIQKFCHPENQNAVLAELLLYDYFPDLLNPEEKKRFQVLKKAYRHRLRSIKKKHQDSLK